MPLPEVASGYAELWAASNFSFLRGASHPGELVVTAKALGLAAIGVADRNTLAGVVRAWAKGREIGQKVFTGSRLVFADGTPDLVCYPVDREAWGRLTRLLTVGQRRAPKGECHLEVGDLMEHGEGQVLLAIPPARPDADFETRLKALAEAFPGRVRLLGSRAYGARDLKRLHALDALGARAGAPLIAGGDILYHGPERRPLQDVVTCIREGVTIATAGLALEANSERHLKAPAEMARLFAPWPAAIARTLEVMDEIGFDLSQLRYEYPDEPVPPGKTAIGHLTDLAWRGADWRYPDGVPENVKRRLRDELALIEELDYPNYFLTVHDIVHWARGQGILCQGRGSAANSTVCFCLGVTCVDPEQPKHDLLFARFISRERDEPPDIDVDFEHERRERVMQYVYDRYGRHRAAICATVIHYRSRSAIREVGKALGLTEDITAALAGTIWTSWGEEVAEDHVRQAGLDPENPEIRRATILAVELMGFPRHLSQHVGGFVLTRRRLDETVPIGNGAMKDRTFIEWDKDDIDALGLMKVDVLALGMLSAIRKGMDLMGIADMADIPPDDEGVYEMLSRADSVGVFQVESRAQMAMLPRMKPKEFYDLVIEVAIVRPGPIQGDMVHPYLRRRERLEVENLPGPSPEHGAPNELKAVLGKTLGVPLFQEQAMRLAIEAAKFTPEEANGLRRAMATFKHEGDVGIYGEKFVGGMVARGYDPDFARRCFKQIEGFGSYGFPESHAVSFAKLVYISAWIKRHRPDVFCVALLNSQPMGFYQPAQLVRDAREHGVEVRPADILKSGWDSTLEGEPGAGKARAVRLGLRQIKGLAREEAERLIAAREAGARTIADLAARAGVKRRTLERLAEADALRAADLGRREGLWTVKALEPPDAPLLALMGPAPEVPVDLPAMALGAHVAEDYRTTQLSLKAHPCAFFRPRLQEMGAARAIDLKAMTDGARLRVGGLVLIRQRPGTAKGVVFLTLEDETGSANAVVWPDVFAANRRVVMSARFLLVHGRLQRAGEVIHLVAERFTDLSARLAELWDADIRPAPPSGRSTGPPLVRSRDFH
jgi:error-prone DNA polymerase